MEEPSQPLSLLMIFTPQKKREGKFWVYFRLLSAQKATTPIIAAIATAAIIAISVVIKGSGSVGSGSIGVAGVTGGPTPMAVSAYELK